MIKLTERKQEILQAIADRIDTEVYYYFTVEQRDDGIYLMPDTPRFIGDPGDFMGTTFEEAKANIGEFVAFLNIK
jgi:hypothetical protein